MATPRRLQDWIAALGDTHLPVLPFSERVLARLAQESEPPPVGELCAIIYRDPALVHHILRTANGLRHRHLSARVQSLEQAVMMLGVHRVLKSPQQLPKLESLPEINRDGYLRAISGAYHAAVQAWSWARERLDMQPAEVFTAALLRHIGAMALWAHGGRVMPTLTGAAAYQDGYRDDAEYVMLGFTLDDLSLGLAQHSRLPTLVCENLRPEKVPGPRSFGIVLANRIDTLARYGWGHPEMPRLLDLLAELMQTDRSEAQRLVRAAALQAYQETNFYPSHEYAPLLQLPDADQAEDADPAPVRAAPQLPPAKPRQTFCIAPRPSLLTRVTQELEAADYQRVRQELAAKHDFVAEDDPIICLGLRALHTGAGLSRVLFLKPSGHRDLCTAYMLRGAERNPFFNRMRLGVAAEGVMAQLLERPRVVWVHEDNWEQMRPKLPKELRGLGVRNFLLGSVFAGTKPVGLIYADRHLPGSALDRTAVSRFEAICKLVGRQIARGHAPSAA